MKLQIRYHLPFITLTAAYHGNAIRIPNVLIDTGSAGTILNVDMLEAWITDLILMEY